MNPTKGVESEDKTSKNEPISRWMHSAVLLGEKKMVIFGGCKEDLLLTDEVWTFDIGILILPAYIYIISMSQVYYF